MLIAVSFCHLPAIRTGNDAHFLFETCSRIAIAHPEHQFVFLYTGASVPFALDASNVRFIRIRPRKRNLLMWKFWYRYTLPATLKKIKADIVVTMDGVGALHGKIPQCLIVQDLFWLDQPSLLSRRSLRFYRKHIPLQLQKAAGVVTVSAISKNHIAQQYGIDPGKIAVIPKGIEPGFAPVLFDQSFATKEKLTGNKEYFLYVGTIHPRKNIMNLLKAFSLFKKRQQTNMQLVLAGAMEQGYEHFTADLQRYKFRDDVVITGHLSTEALGPIIGSAYALIHPSPAEGFGSAVAEAMQAQVPVLASRDSAMQEIAGDAGRYFDPQLPESIADQMKLIYKDEALRNRLVAHTGAKAGNLSWQQTATSLYAYLEQLTGK